jgi:hypothetical protein
MKNIIAENFLRFAPKNLSEADSKKIQQLAEQDPNITTAPEVRVRPKMQNTDKPLPGFAKGQKMTLGTLVSKAGEGKLQIQAAGEVGFEPTWTVTSAFTQRSYDKSGKSGLSANLFLTNSVMGELYIQADGIDYYVEYTPAAGIEKYTITPGSLGPKATGNMPVQDGLVHTGIIGNNVSKTVFSKSPINTMLRALQSAPTNTSPVNSPSTPTPR